MTPPLRVGSAEPPQTRWSSGLGVAGHGNQQRVALHLAVAGAHPVFAWADDGLHVFASHCDAERYVEGIDVEHGVWEGFWAVDGRVLEAEVDGSRVKLRLTDSVAGAELDRRLLEAVDALGIEAPADDRIAVANEVLRRDWDARWPQWPRWLDRRLHESGPPQ
jgi:hypothetical protein